VSRREEWRQQVKLSLLLDKWLDPACTFWTATDPVAASALAGKMRKLRGIKSGVPDLLLWRRRAKPITSEMKSPGGRCSASQRATRAALLRAGCVWWQCDSANSAMWALRKSGVRFRVIANEDGTVERWKQPRLADWENPRTDPRERRPAHPEVRAARKLWRERRRAAREAALAAERDAAAGGDIAA
jgi:hypothetical protein